MFDLSNLLKPQLLVGLGAILVIVQTLLLRHSNRRVQDDFFLGRIGIYSFFIGICAWYLGGFKASVFLKEAVMFALLLSIELCLLLFIDKIRILGIFKSPRIWLYVVLIIYFCMYYYFFGDGIFIGPQ